MFIKERDWIRESVASLEIAKPICVLDIGSQSLEYRTKKQPYLGKLYDFMSQGKCNLSTLDMDASVGADYQLDISSYNFPNIGQFDLVLACNILEHIYKDRLEVAIHNINHVTGKFLVVTLPLYYPWHFHPIDNGLRLTPEELASFFPKFKVRRSASWEDEHYSKKYIGTPKPWVSGVLLEKT